MSDPYDNFTRHGVDNSRSAIISPDAIDRAKAVDILAVAQQYGAGLKRRAGGDEYGGPCPVCGQQ
jgi:hypothetical protein